MRKRFLAVLLALCVTLPVMPASVMAAGNTSYADAIAVEDGETVTLEDADPDVAYYYSVLTTAPGQMIRVTGVTGVPYIRVSTADGTSCSSSGDVYSTGEAGTYYILLRFAEGTVSFTVNLLDNDECEPNDTAQTAAPLISGEPVDFVLMRPDMDYFTVETDQPAQDIAVEISGFSYAMQGWVYLEFDGDYVVQGSQDGTFYFHAAEAGRHTIRFYNSYNTGNPSEPLSLTLTATVLDGDENEPNDTADTANRLYIGTDQYFSMGGYGDEDWFTFEAAPEEGEDQKLYTLNFLDLNTDYSDQFYYDVYAPDGTAVVTGTLVNIRHSNILACTQQGLYAVRVYSREPQTPRSTLRIRVEEGGADPYESNDTWLTAREAQADSPVQFILSTASDQDWFKFEVPEADMTLAMTFDSTLSFTLYSGAALQQSGANASGLCFSSDYTSGTASYKFTETGTYYVKLYASQSYVSADLRTMTLSLEPPRDTENNDTWKNATPIYEGVPKNYDISAYNDVDWFKIEVPDGVESMVVESDAIDTSMWLYRQVDFETAGDNAGAISNVNGSTAITLSAPAAETYYVECGYKYSRISGDRRMNQTICYVLSDKSIPGSTMETATELAPGEWYEGIAGGYFSLGQLAAGDEVRVSCDADDFIYLYNDSGVMVESFWNRNCKNYSLYIPDDGEYCLNVSFSSGIDANGEANSYHLRYDVGNVTYDSVTIEGPDELTLKVGETVNPDLRLFPYDADMGTTGSGNIFKLSSGDSGIVSVSSYSLLTANKVGDALITVSCYLNTSAAVQSRTITVHVVDETPAVSLTITGAPTELPLGSKAALAAVLSPADASSSVTWTSSDPDVLYVNSAGVVTAVGSGCATITAASGQASDSVTIETTAAPETVKVNSVTLDKYSMTLYVGEDASQLTATVKPANAANANVAWTSSAPAVATVDQTGAVQPVAAGVAVITASAGGYKASCVVTVQPARVRVESISFEKEEIEIPLLGKGTTLLPVISPANATVKTVTWVSSDEGVASVSRTGIVTPVSVGETTVTVTTLDGEKTASITVRVVVSPQLGDINLDGYIDSADAMMALQVAVGKIVLSEEQEAVADVNKDGYVDAADAVRILRYDARLIDSLAG